jgi:hypothetical protein
VSGNSSNGGGNENSDNYRVDRYIITARDLLQANATIVAGVLIFVSLSASLSQFDTPFVIYGVIIVALGTIPFVYSIIFLVDDYRDITFGFRRAKVATRIGLQYLIGTILLFLVLSLIGPRANGNN